MRLSYSQYGTYQKCAYAWYLQKRKKVPQRPAAWLAQGTAAHAAWEADERSGRTLTPEAVETVFIDSYADEIARYAEEWPNFGYWFASGPYRGKVDIERRFGLGLAQLPGYRRWYDAHPSEVVWVAPDGTPGIEMEFDLDLDGVTVRGYIDLLIDAGNGNVLIRDNKTGNAPGDEVQLAVYGVAVEDRYGVKPEFGDYWMGKTGKATARYDLTEWDRARITGMFHDLADRIDDERFDPSPEPSKCRMCSVSAECDFSL